MADRYQFRRSSNGRRVSREFLTEDPSGIGSDAGRGIALDVDEQINKTILHGRPVRYTAVSGPIGIADARGTVVVTAESTQTLPDAAVFAGEFFFVKRLGSGDVTVDTVMGQTIDGEDSDVININKWTQQYQSDGANWIVL